MRYLTPAFLSLLILAGAADASTAFYINSTDAPGGAPVSGPSWTGGHQLDAEVIFSTSGNTLTIQLIDLITNEVTDAQGISGLQFNIAASGNGTDTTSVAGYGGVGQMVNIASSGAVSDAGTCTGACLSAWSALTSLSEGTATVSMYGFNSSPNPYTIAGVPSSDGNYDSANPSVGNHSPFFEESATFTLTGLTGINASSISDVTLNFGTASGQTVATGNAFATPEPGSLSLAVAGAALVFAGVRRKRVQD